MLRKKFRKDPASVVFALALLFCVVLFGCGGLFFGSEGATESRYALTQVPGTVDLGTRGRAATPLPLTVRTAAGIGNVGTDNTVTTTIFANGPQYAEILDSQNRTVMMGFASPDDPNFSANSTAKALCYLALSGAWMKEDGRLKLLREADTVAGFSTLLAAIQAQLDANGYLDIDAAPIQEALTTIVTGVYGTGPSPGRGTLADPVTASGLSLDTTVDSRLGIQNVYLRRVSFFFRRLSHVPAVGNEVIETNAFTRIDIENVARYAGITGTLDSYFKGEVAYSPKSIDPPLDIPRFPGNAKQTVYQIFAIGAGGSSHPNLQVPAEIISEQQTLEMKTLVLDGLLVLIANCALPVAGEEVDKFLKFAAGNAIITDIIAGIKANVPDVGVKLGQGKFLEATLSALTSAYTSNTALPLLTQLTLDFLYQNTSLSGDNYDKILNGMKGVLDKMGKIDVGFTLADTFLLGRDIAVSKKIEQFIVTTTPGKITLDVTKTPIKPSESTTIHAIIQDKDPQGTYEYHWSVSPNGNYWLEDSSLKGTDDVQDGVLITGDDTVTIRSAVLTEGTAIVKCKAFRLDGGKREIAENTTAVEFKLSNIITTVYDDYKTMSVVAQGTDGKWHGAGGTYIDIPRSTLVRDYFMGYKSFYSASSVSKTLLEPVTVNEFSLEGGSQYWFGSAPSDVIRLWVHFWSGGYHNTKAKAETEITNMIPSKITYAKARPVTVSSHLL